MTCIKRKEISAEICLAGNVRNVSQKSNGIIRNEKQSY